MKLWTIEDELPLFRRLIDVAVAGGFATDLDLDFIEDYAHVTGQCVADVRGELLATTPTDVDEATRDYLLAEWDRLLDERIAELGRIAASLPD